MGQGIVSGSLSDMAAAKRGFSAYEIAKQLGYEGTKREWIESLSYNPSARVTTLDGTPLASGTVLEAVGIPVYVDDVAEYEEYGLTEAGWYIFARITAPAGVTVTEETVVEGVIGCIKEEGADHVDVAIGFAVAAISQVVTVEWSEEITDTFVFKATDLGIRNLDRLTTFYVYDIAKYTTWEYKPTVDATFIGTAYYTKSGDVYTQAAVIANTEIPPETYYTHAYVLTEDTVFAGGVIYYTKSGNVYTAAEVTPGEAVTENTYYVDQYTLTEDATFVGTAYYVIEDGQHVPAAVKAGEAIPAIYYVDQYDLTEDEIFIAGTVYYTESEGVYTAAEVTVGEAVPENTYYVHSYVLTEDTELAEGKNYYTLSGTTYTAAEVTAGEAVPADTYYVHSKVRFEGMVRNVTYRCDTIIDCPMDFVLPAIEDETHGAWFEIRCRHAGAYSMTLVPSEEGVKIATEHTQKETAGVNRIMLDYTVVDGVKIWRFMNTHSSIPA